MPDASRPDWSGRLERQRHWLRERRLEALVVSLPVNIRYLTGFTGSAGLLVVSTVTQFLVADGRYQFAIRRGLEDRTLGPVQLEPIERQYDRALARLLQRLGLTRVGFEAEHTTVATLRSWQTAAAEVMWEPIDRSVEQFRLVKDAIEIAHLRRGGGLLADVASHLASWVRQDRTERQVAGDIDRAIGDAGFEALAFPTIVASGPHSAHPHARPTDRRLSTGDLVVLDFGGVLDGYCVDLTRMAAIGQVGTERRALFDAVRDAQQAALAAVRPGIPGSVIDGAAREVLEARGLGPAFLHSTGHGLGLEVHEAPRIGRADPDAPGFDLLETGMVFTVEPGAYVDGLGGVRLEDDVLVTTDGCEVLTGASRDLLVV